MAADREKARRLAEQGKSAQQIARKTDLSPAAARNVVKNWAPSSGTNNTTTTVTDFTPQDWASSIGDAFSGVYQNIQTGQENLAHIQGGYSTQAAQIGANAAVSSAGIRADADKEVARAYADAQKYAAGLGLEGVKYGADKESEWRQAVANIEVKGKLDLQPIINAGLEKVAGIEAQASRDVAETTGKYSLESMKQRTSADKSIGKMQLAGSMYGLLGSVFG